MEWEEVRLNEMTQEQAELFRPLVCSEMTIIVGDGVQTSVTYEVKKQLGGGLEVAQAVEWEDQELFPAVHVWLAAQSDVASVEAAALEEVEGRVLRCLRRLEELLGGREYFAGAEAGAVDAVYYASVSAAARLSEALGRWVRRMGEKEWVRAAEARSGCDGVGSGREAQLAAAQGEVGVRLGRVSRRRRFELRGLRDKPYMVTTPIFYVNGEPHVGHVYTTLLCDAMARWLRLRGADVTFMTGTDEHGQKVMEAAKQRGVTPLAFATEVSGRFRTCFDRMRFSYDRFIRTTSPEHARCVAEMWRRMEARGDIYLGSYEGWYCTSDEAFYTAQDVVEVVEADGSKTMRARESGQPVHWTKEENVMFRLSKYQQPLLDWLDANPTAIIPSFRMRDIRRFIAGGLRDLSISRTSFDWGLPVPGHDKHVIYVWVDALSNYLTVAGFPDHPDGRPLWPADYQVVGKDILRFHAIYWPAFLLSAGLPLPSCIVAHGWWTKDHCKISKSLGNVFDPVAVAEDYGHDALRYFLLRSASLEADGDFSYDELTLRLDKELADDWGNLVMRSLSRAIVRDGCVTACADMLPADCDLRDELNALSGTLDHHFRRFAFNVGLTALWAVIDRLNLYVNENRPWRLAKLPDDPQALSRLGTVMYVLVEAVRITSLLLLPILPEKAALVLDWLDIPASDRFISFARFGVLQSGHPLQTADKLFEKRGILKLQKKK